MKTLLKILCLFMLVGNTHFSSGMPSIKKKSAIIKANIDAQEMFDYFRAHRQGSRGVTLNWGMSSMSGVAFFKILYSDNGEYFNEIAIVSPGGNRQSWKHFSVFPGYNHYRIVCIMEDLTEIISETETVRIVQHG